MIRFAKALLMAALAASACLAQAPSAPATAADADKAGAYYNFAMGRLYAELAGSATNQSEYVNKAIQYYQAALRIDPSASLALEELTDVYLQTGKLQDAIDQADALLQKNPDNLAARRILGRIYTRAISNAQDNRIDETMVRHAIEQYEKITEKDPKDAESRVILGRLYRVTNNSAGAEKVFNEALKISPDDEDALASLAMLYSDMGDNQQAIDKLKTATDKTPSETTLTALAEAYERVRDFKNAASALERAISVAPDNDRLKSQFAQDLLFSDQYDRALELYQQIAADDPHDTASQLRIAEIYRSKRDLPKAREALNKAKQIDANDLNVAYEEINLLDAEGKNDEAIAKLKSLLDSSARRTYSPAQKASRAALLKRLGWLYRTEAEYPQAIDVFRQIANLDSDSAAEATVLVIDTYRQAKDLASAQREAEDALKKFPAERTVRIAHAEVISDAGKIDEAVAEVKALGAKDRDIQMEIAQIYEKGKRWADVEKTLDEAEKLSTSDDQKEGVNFMRGAMYERQKKFDLSEAAFRKVLQSNPDNAGALNYLGYMLADRNVRLDEAHDLISKALDQDPQNGAYLDSLGWVYYRQGKLGQAEEALLRSLEHMGQDPTVHDHLGDVYFKQGKTKEAIAQWQVSVAEFQSAPPSENDPELLASVTKKLEGARVRLAKENGQK